MKKETYRIRFRHAQWSAGDEIQLSEDEAIRLDNKAPGVLERIIPIELDHTQDRVHGEGRAGNRPPKEPA